MNTTGQRASELSTRTGFRARLCSDVGVKGTRALKVTRVVFLSLFALAVSAAPALAAAPEAPELKVEHVWASTAVFQGTLSPGSGVPAEGSYVFLYRASKKECTGAGGKQTTPGLAGVLSGGLDEVLPAEQVVGLSPVTEYTVCLQIENLAKEAVKSPPVTFKTVKAAKPEAPEASEVSEREATTATLNGVLNPKTEGEPGHYRFLYAQSAGVCTGGLETPEEPVSGLTSGETPEAVSAAITGLEPGKPYTFCLKAFNALGEATLSPPKTFTAAVSPETPEGVQLVEAKGTALKLRGVVNPKAAGEAGTYEFLYRRSGSECEGEGGAASAALPSAGGLGEEAAGEITGLLPHTTYAICLRAHNVAGEASSASSPAVSFATLAVAPVASEEAATEVTGESARLQGLLNPGGAQTTYAFRYGTSSGYGSSAPLAGGDGGAGILAVPVAVQVEGLLPATTYHYCLLATSTVVPAGICGEDRTFTTQPAASSAALIDGRAWEMVSPADKHGAPLTTSEEEVGLVQASADGSRISYFAYGPIDTDPEGSRSFALQQQLSSRTAPGVWGTQDLATRQEEVRGLLGFANLTEYKMFSSDLSSGLVEPEGATLLSSAATERTPYLRDDQTGEYLPLLPAAGMRPGVKFGGEQEGPGNKINFGVKFLTATPDLSHVLLTSEVPLTTDFKESFEDHQNVGVAQFEQNLYEWSAGTLKLVNILPDGVPASEAGLHSDIGAGAAGGEQMRNAVSTDGSRVVFQTTAGGGEPHLWLRDMSLGQTLQLDLPQPGGELGNERPQFIDANTDGSRIFFTDKQRLTEAATVGPNLYMCEVPVPAPGGSLECKLKYLSGEFLHLREEAGVQPEGVDLGTDETGAYIYYITGTPQSPTLVVQDVETGEVRVIAALSEEDSPDWANGEEDFGKLTSRVSPNGRYVAFMSDLSLTGYDNRDAVSGVPDEEVYLYDRVANTLRCVSCDPTGARPQGVYDPGNNTAGFRKHEVPLLIDKTEVWGERWLAGSLPGWPKISTRALYQPRNLDDSGRLFFDSPDALVPHDVNGKEDVYEYEPDHVGGCALSEGCVGLISSGTSSEESAFLDASATGPGGQEGEDVFFMTASKLAPTDLDSSLDVYDAHTCSAAAPCASTVPVLPPSCATAESCRPAPAPEPDIFGAPASATFSGPGNTTPALAPPPAKGETAVQKRAKQLTAALKTCRRKHNKPKRTSCEKAARKAYGAKASARRSSAARVGER